jgi:hypothetical protein
MPLAWKGMGGVGLCSVRNAKTLKPSVCVLRACDSCLPALLLVC